MNAELESLCNEWLGALMSGGAQGLVVILAVWLLLKTWRGANAATRHVVWFAALLLVALLPALLLLAPFGSDITQRLRSLARDGVRAALVGSPEFERPTTGSASIGFLQTIQAEEPLVVPPEAIEAEPAFTAPRWQVATRGAVSVSVVATLGLLASIRLVALARQLFVLRRFKREGTRADAPLNGIFQHSVSLLNCGRHPQLLISDEAPAPMVVGYFHPAVLLPTAVMKGATRAQLEQIFRHELAHIARNDDWANLVQQVIASIFFFHPGIWIASRRLTTEREIACDDHALAGLPTPRDYALLLTEFASRIKGRDYPAAPAAWNRNSQLKERIAMILDKQRNASTRVSRTGVGALTLATFGLAFAALIAFPRITLAGPAPDPTAHETSADSADIAIKTTVDVDVSSEATPRVQIRRHGLKASGVNGDVLATPPLEKPEPAAPPAPPAPVAPSDLPHPAPNPLVHPTPAVKLDPNKTMIVAPDGRTLELKPQPRQNPKREDGGLERRLERVERLLESLVASKKVKMDTLDIAKTLPPDFEGKLKAEIAHAQKDAEQALKGLNLQDMRKHAMDDALMQQTLAGKELAFSLDTFKARQRELEQRRRALDREAAALEREMQQLKQNQERLSERKERDGERDKKRAEKEQREHEKAMEREMEFKQRDTGDTLKR